MPNLTLDSNKIVYSLLSIIIFLSGYIINNFVNNSKQIAMKQDEINTQLLKINMQLVEIKKDIMSRNDIVEIVQDELIKSGLKPYGSGK